MTRQNVSTTYLDFQGISDEISQLCTTVNQMWANKITEVLFKARTHKNGEDIGDVLMQDLEALGKEVSDKIANVCIKLPVDGYECGYSEGNYDASMSCVKLLRELTDGNMLMTPTHVSILANTIEAEAKRVFNKTHEHDTLHIDPRNLFDKTEE